MSNSKGILLRLLNARDDREKNFYITGLLTKYRKPMCSPNDDNLVEFCISEEDVRAILLELVAENEQFVQNKIIEWNGK